MQRTKVGDVEIVALVDNITPYAVTAVYPQAGAALDAYRHYLDDQGRVALNFGCFLVVDGETRLLVDTGWGPEHDGRLPDELREAGIDRDSVTHVLFTHLHGDHTGWNIDRPTGKPLFANARYLVPKADWDHYSAQGSASFARDVAPLEPAGQMDLVEGEHIISRALVTVATPGHTPGHTSVAITSGGEHGFILGDVVISPIDAERPEFRNSFDWDHDIAHRTREATLARLVAEGALVGASHLPAPGLGRFTPRWKAVE